MPRKAKVTFQPAAFFFSRGRETADQTTVSGTKPNRCSQRSENVGGPGPECFLPTRGPAAQHIQPRTLKPTELHTFCYAFTATVTNRTKFELRLHELQTWLIINILTNADKYCNLPQEGRSHPTFSGTAGRSTARQTELQKAKWKTWNALWRLSVHILLFLFLDPLLISHRHALPWQPWEFWVMANKRCCQQLWLFQSSGASSAFIVQFNEENRQKKETFKGVFIRAAFSFVHL